MQHHMQWRQVSSIIAVFLLLAGLTAYSDEVPKIKTNWSLKDGALTLEITNLGSKAIQISSLGDYRSKDISDIDITDLDRIGFIQHGDKIINACIMFFMKTKHPELSSSSRGGRIPPPETIPAGEHGTVKFPLDGNFVSVAGLSDKIKLLLIYDNKIIDVSQLTKKGDNFYGD